MVKRCYPSSLHCLRPASSATSFFIGITALKSNILWQHHKMHHLDPEFDALTGPRQNWLENFFIVFFISIPVALLFKLNATDALGAGLTQGAIIGFWTLLNFQN